MHTPDAARQVLGHHVASGCEKCGLAFARNIHPISSSPIPSMHVQTNQEQASESSKDDCSKGKHGLLATCGLSHAALAAGGVLPAICLVQIAAQFDLSDAQCGLMFAVGPTITLFTLPLFGLLAERYGKQVLLVLGLGLLALGLLLIRNASEFYPLLVVQPPWDSLRPLSMGW